VAAVAIGLFLAVPVAFGPQHLFGRLFDFHYLFYGGTLVTVGVQGIMGAILVRDLVGGVIMRPNRLATSFANWLTLLRGLILGGVFALAGAVLEASVLYVWIRGHFGPLYEPRRSVLGMLLLGLGAEVMMFSFLHAVLRRHLSARGRGSPTRGGEPNGTA
jgi:hypothetical protein